MKILKHGDVDLINKKGKVKSFTCYYCLCEFTADETEYTTNSDSTTLFDSDLIFGSAICPECGEDVVTTWRS